VKSRRRPTFSFLYQLAGGTLEDTPIANTATITSFTSELHTPDNTSLAEATIIAGAAPASCTLDGPYNIAVAVNTIQNTHSVQSSSSQVQQIRIIRGDQNGCFHSTSVACGPNATWTITNNTAADCGQ